MASALGIKQGATLQLLLAVANDDDSAFNLASVTYAAEVRNAYGGLVAMLTLTPTGTPGQLAVAHDTTGWPVGTLSGDLKFTDLSTAVVVKSDTFTIVVTAAMTE